MRYEIHYTTKNTYVSAIGDSLWQFMVTPMDNATQHLVSFDFQNSIGVYNQDSVNGFGFKTVKVHAKEPLKTFEFKLKAVVEKLEINPFSSNNIPDLQGDIDSINSLPFKTKHEGFLTATEQTRIPLKYESLYKFDADISLFENLVALNKWSFSFFTFETEVTSVGTTITEILDNKKGVCQDFTHVFCGLARLNSIPTRYVSGYLHQGLGLAGDSQMHAWVECFIPRLGWVGFDPTNNILANHNHIKVCHGRDYQDCAPLKGIIHGSTSSEDETIYTVFVKLLPEVNDSSEEEPVASLPVRQQSHIITQQWQQQQ